MKNISKTISLVLFVITLGSTAKAQLNPLAAQYYTNQYIGNPAIAGTFNGLRISGVYRSLHNNIPGAPINQNLTGEFGFKKVGVGVNLTNESDGLFKRTRFVGTYAYHLPLNGEDQKLDFGVSVGFLAQRLGQASDVSNGADPMIGQYNSRRTYIDGDFGIAYTSKGLNLQFALPNLKSFFKQDDIKAANVNTFYSALSYKFTVGKGEDGFAFEPKVGYRGIKEADNLWDAGLQVGLVNEQVLLTGLYHSTKNATFGIGMDFKKKYLISGLYTTQTAALSGYTNGSFELNLRLSLGK